MNKITGLLQELKTQKFWLVLIAGLLILFTYGELTATRLFAGTATEQWKPQGANSQNSIHHK